MKKHHPYTLTSRICLLAMLGNLAGPLALAENPSTSAPELPTSLRVMTQPTAAAPAAVPAPEAKAKSIENEEKDNGVALCAGHGYGAKIAEEWPGQKQPEIDKRWKSFIDGYQNEKKVDTKALKGDAAIQASKAYFTRSFEDKKRSVAALCWLYGKVAKRAPALAKDAGATVQEAKGNEAAICAGSFRKIDDVYLDVSSQMNQLKKAFEDDTKIDTNNTTTSTSRLANFARANMQCYLSVKAEPTNNEVCQRVYGADLNGGEKVVSDLVNTIKNKAPSNVFYIDHMKQELVQMKHLQKLIEGFKTNMSKFDELANKCRSYNVKNAAAKANSTPLPPRRPTEIGGSGSKVTPALGDGVDKTLTPKGAGAQPLVDTKGSGKGPAVPPPGGDPNSPWCSDPATCSSGGGPVGVYTPGDSQFDKRLTTETPPPTPSTPPGKSVTDGVTGFVKDNWVLLGLGAVGVGGGIYLYEQNKKQQDEAAKAAWYADDTNWMPFVPRYSPPPSTTTVVTTTGSGGTLPPGGSRLVITSAINGATTGQPMDPITVVMVDGSGMQLNNIGTQITASCYSPQPCSLSGGMGITTVSGSVTFTNLYFVQPDQNVKIQFSAPGFPTVTSPNTFNVSGTAPRQ
jgi:hypothetical protein